MIGMTVGLVACLGRVERAGTDWGTSRPRCAASPAVLPINLIILWIILFAFHPCLAPWPTIKKCAFSAKSLDFRAPSGARSFGTIIADLERSQARNTTPEGFAGFDLFRETSEACLGANVC